MVRRFAIGLMLLMGLVAAFYSGLWFFFAHQIWQSLESWRGIIQWKQADLDGFPGPITIHWQDVRATTPSGIVWNADSVTGKISPFSPRTIHFSVDSEQTLTLPQQAPQTVQTARAALDLTVGPLPQAVLLLDALTLNGTMLAKRVHLSLSALDPVTAAPDTPQHRIPHWSFVLYSQDWQLPHPPTGFDPVIAGLSLSGRVQGSLDRGLMSWSNDGGTVEVERFSLDWQPITMDGSGTLALTPQGGVTLALSTATTGLPAVIDSLTQQKLMGSGAAQAAKLSLSLLMRPDAMGRPALSLPLTVQDDQLRFGPLPSIPLPKWRLWGHNP